MAKTLFEKFKESLFAVLPIAALVIIIALLLPGIDGYIIGLFGGGTVLLIIGMALFTLGADVAMMPMGNTVGSFLSKTKKKNFWIVVIIAFVIGFVITLAEPDLTVLADQLGSKLIIYSVAAGVGMFLVVSIFRTFFNVKLQYILVGSYLVVFALAIALQFIRPEFLAAAFDSGGVTTGPITVPFLMALGLGIASSRGTKGNQEDSFGTIALCSVGPIIAVLIMGLTGAITLKEQITNPIVINSVSDLFALLGHGILEHMGEVAMALLPIIAVFFLFQIFVLKLQKGQVIRIIIGIVYTFIGLTVFLAGVNVGFMPMGNAIGGEIASSDFKWVLIPLGMLMGALIVLAEPAIHILNKQVEEVTAGAISKKLMLICLCVGISVSVGLSMLRVLTGVSIWYFIVPVYVISLTLTFFVPKIFTGIAFDSGGVASGPMTATFLLPLAIGACHALSGDVFSDAFGLVAFVAMTPLITIQLLGLIFKIKTSRLNKKAIIRAKEGRSIGAIDSVDTVEFDVSENKENESIKSDNENKELNDISKDDTNDTVDFDLTI